MTNLAPTHVSSAQVAAATPGRGPAPHQLILRTQLSPGDVLMLTAAVRDLHAAYPSRFATDVRTSAPALWRHNPYLTRLDETAADVEIVDAHYPLIQQSNTRPHHFIQGYVRFLEERLGVTIPLTRFCGDIHLSEDEKRLPCPTIEHGLEGDFWILMAGGKYDFTTKWWNPASYQAVVDQLRGRVRFVQCGEQNHWHPPLDGVLDLRGRTTLRQFVLLMHHAAGVLCPITFAMHLAAAVPTRAGRSPTRPCVVIAGGREPPHWESYPHHQFLHTVGALACSAQGGCWKSRCQPVGDGSLKDVTDVCEQPVQINAELRIPRCMELITAADVVRRIEWYHDGGAIGWVPRLSGLVEYAAPSRAASDHRRLLLRFRHGLGDVVQLSIVLRHLAAEHPEWEVDVVAPSGRGGILAGVCRRTMSEGEAEVDEAAYDQVCDLAWDEHLSGRDDAPSTKATHCLVDQFFLAPREELCRYALTIGADARVRARRVLSHVCQREVADDQRYPVVVLHYQGHSSQPRKNLPDALVGNLCRLVRELGAVPLLLDWEHRSRLPEELGMARLGAGHDLWGGDSAGDAEALAAIIDGACLFVGIDSGPLHVAGATTTPAIGVWTAHHPVHYFDLADNVTHLVPTDHAKRVWGPKAAGYFRNKYRHRVYDTLEVDLPAQVESLLTRRPLASVRNRRFLDSLPAVGFGPRYYHEQKLLGIDYARYGRWHDRYGRWLVSALDWRGRPVLDVGCACGAVTRAMRVAGAQAVGIDLSEFMTRLGRDTWPELVGFLGVVDATNLHVFLDGQFDGVHLAHVAEYLEESRIPTLLAELRRVAARGCQLAFCVATSDWLVGQTVLGRGDRRLACVRPSAWWWDQLRRSGWQPLEPPRERAWREHGESLHAHARGEWLLAELRTGERNDDKEPGNAIH